MIAIVLFGCVKEGFSVDSIDISRTISATVDTDGILSDITETASISSVISPSDKKYTFRLVSPDGDLAWEGSLKGSRRTSEELLITPGASFPEGEYSVIIYSEEGLTYSDTIVLPSSDLSNNPYLDSTGNLINGKGSDVLYYFEDKETENKDSAEYAVINYRDRYGNIIRLRSELI